MATEKEEIEIFSEWMTLDSYKFKILAIISILANEQRAFRGTLNEFCEHLDIQNSSANKDKLKSTLSCLEEKEYVKIIVDKQIYTISLAAAAEKSPSIKKLKRAWYQLIRSRAGKVNWGNTLKVFLHLIDIPPDNITTYAEIGAALSISASTVERCVKTICSIDFEDFEIQKTIVSKKQADGTIHCLGQTYERVLNFEK